MENNPFIKFHRIVTQGRYLGNTSSLTDIEICAKSFVETRLEGCEYISKSKRA
jgi:hypothetical protein